MRDGALARTTTQTCGGIPGTNIPNNTYGHGRIDALASYELIPPDPTTHTLSVIKSATTPAIAPGEQLTYTLTVSHSHAFSPTHNVVLTDGAIVRWERSVLGPDMAWDVALVVDTSAVSGSSLVNEHYGSSSDEVSYVGGPPVIVLVELQNHYFLSLVRAPAQTEAER